MIKGLINNNSFCGVNDYTTFFVTFDDKLEWLSNKTNQEEKQFDNGDNNYSTNIIRKINLRYYNTDFNNFSIYNKTNDEPKKNKVNKVNNFKKVIDLEFNKNTPQISSKCSSNTKILNKFITIFSGPNNKNILDKIVGNNLHIKI